MRLNRKQAFGIAAIIAGIAFVLVYYLLSSSTRSEQEQKPQMVGVVMATTNIPPYAKITPGMVDIKSVAATTAPTNALTSPNEVVGRIAQYAISQGQLLVRGDVVTADATQGLTFVIPKGRRAVTVALDPISGVGGFVYPGDRVDVLATFERDEMSSTRVILQNIEILAMNEQTVRPKAANGGDTGPGTPGESPVVEQVKNATLAVTPEEAQRLILAVYEGTIHMVLRAREDSNGIHDLMATTDWDLMGMKPPEPSEEEDAVDPAATQQMMGWPPGYMTPPTTVTTPDQSTAPAAPTIEVIRGSEHSTVMTDQ
jgi:pilus assembly protein CpaB